MTIQMKRPERKFQDVKVTEEDIILFTLGIDKSEFILPSERDSYMMDLRAVQLVEDIKAGKDVSNKDYRGINLKGADISGANFKGCNFSKACFYKTKASKCNFDDAIFDDAYMEDVDFEESSFKLASFKRVFLRNNDFKSAELDESTEKYFSDFDKFLSLIEAGKIDIKTLSKSDLLCVDIRRLDLRKVNLDGIDLSQFALDGINLCGTYIDPKHLLSLKGLQKYYFDLRKTKEKKRKQMEEAVLKEKEEKLIEFSKKQKKVSLKSLDSVPNRPPKKQEDEPYRTWPKAELYEQLSEEDKIDTPVQIKKSASDTEEHQINNTVQPTMMTEEMVKQKITSKTQQVEKRKFKTKG